MRPLINTIISALVSVACASGLTSSSLCPLYRAIGECWCEDAGPSIGEESGTLDEMLGKVADQYEMQVDNAVDSISSLIEPMIMSILGILIGGIMIAMYLPIFMLGSVM